MTSLRTTPFCLYRSLVASKGTVHTKTAQQVENAIYLKQIKKTDTSVHSTVCSDAAFASSVSTDSVCTAPKKRNKRKHAISGENSWNFTRWCIWTLVVINWLHSECTGEVAAHLSIPRPPEYFWNVFPTFFNL